MSESLSEDGSAGVVVGSTMVQQEGNGKNVALKSRGLEINSGGYWNEAGSAGGATGSTVATQEGVGRNVAFDSGDSETYLSEDGSAGVLLERP